MEISLAEKILQLRARSPKWRGFRTLSGLAGQVLARPRLYRGLEPGLRLLQAAGFPGEGQFAGLRFSPHSFHRQRQAAGFPRGRLGPTPPAWT